MRREPTEAERRLWSTLRFRQLGVKFVHQRPLGPYIADFYAAEVKLVIEIDGNTHTLPDQVELDCERTAYLEAHGMHVIRFFNHDVMKKLPEVLAMIQHAVSELRVTQ